MTLPNPHINKPSAQCSRIQLVHFSLLTIVLHLLTSSSFNSQSDEIIHPSIFTARDTRAYRTRVRTYFPSPWARVCSPAAREHFLTRFTRAGRPLLPQNPPSVRQSRNRVFMSSLPVEVGDGLGHRTCLLNFELHLSKMFNLTYSHRNSTYGSLTRENRNAVENLFGWGHAEIPREYLLSLGCAEKISVRDNCEIPGENVFCRRIRLRRDGGLFDRTVIIPDALAACFLQRGRDVDIERMCTTPVAAFLSSFPEPNTLFQLAPGRCYHHWLYTNFSGSADWFAGKYWREDIDRSILRIPSLNPKRLHIALHIRRGDFFNYTHRVLIPDATYTDMALRIKTAVDDMTGGDVPMTVHVFSEGVSTDGRVKDNHDTRRMQAVYVNEHGVRKKEGYWEEMLNNHVRRRGKDLKVKMHIASNTIQTVHDMLTADFFVGSLSGLSMQVVRYVSRGVVMLPLHESEVEIGEEVVVFDYGRNGIDSFVNESEMYEAVGKYVRRNRIACSVW